MPASSAILSLLPKVRIANDFSHSGVRSMNVLPTASNGDAAGAMRTATRWPTAIAVAASSRPLTAPARRPALPAVLGRAAPWGDSDSGADVEEGHDRDARPDRARMPPRRATVTRLQRSRRSRGGGWFDRALL